MQAKIHHDVFRLKLIRKQQLKKLFCSFHKNFLFEDLLLKFPSSLPAALSERHQSEAFINLRFKQVLVLGPTFAPEHKAVEVQDTQKVNLVFSLGENEVDFLTKSFSPLKIRLKVARLGSLDNISPFISLLLKYFFNLNLWKTEVLLINQGKYFCQELFPCHWRVTLKELLYYVLFSYSVRNLRCLITGLRRIRWLVHV